MWFNALAWYCEKLLCITFTRQTDIVFRSYRMHAVHRCGDYCYICRTSRGGLFVCFCVSVCVGHTGELCINGWTDRDAVCGSEEQCIRWGSRFPKGKGTFELGHVPAYPDIPTHECIAHRSPATPRGGRMHSPSRGVTGWQWRCDLLLNYFKHLFNLPLCRWAQGRRQVPESGVGNTVWGVGRVVPFPFGGKVWEGAMRCPSPEKNCGIFPLQWRLLAHFERAGVEIALISSLQFRCVHTVTNRFYYWKCLTCTAIWKFQVKCRLPQQISWRPVSNGWTI